MSKQISNPRKWFMVSNQRTYWISRLIVSLVYPVVAIRRLSKLPDEINYTFALFLVAVSFFLYICEPFIVRRTRWLRWSYYIAQGGLIMALGWLPPYDDTWALLGIPMSMSIWYENPRREAIVWSMLYAVCLTTTLFIIFGWSYGLGYSLTYLSVYAICLSSGFQSVRSERAQAESQRILGELQDAHGRLKEFASQAEELAAAREHERLIRELHDSVSQTIFSITLMAESTRMLLQEHPEQVPGQLNKIQELTSSSLAQMRKLISQWQLR